MSKLSRRLSVAIALILGLIQVWIGRFHMTLDGITYLDMADAYLRKDWHTAINTGTCNPLYSWLIGLGYLLMRPSGYWEYLVVQLVNFVIFALTVFAFEYFLQGLLKDRKDPIPLRILAYGIFIWTSLMMIRVWLVEPDMLVAACFFAATGILLRPASRWSSLLLGATLAAGYYAKGVMFPISCMVLVGAWLLHSRRQASVATAAFALIASPLVAALSISTGHLTFGETGRINYAMDVFGIGVPFWQGGPAREGRPLHPPHILLDSPKVYEFGQVFPVTYSPFYNQSYWYSGIHLWIAPRTLLHNVIRNAKKVARRFLYGGGGFLFMWAVFALLHRRIHFHMKITPHWVVWLISLGALFLYLPFHLSLRYIGPYTAVLFFVPFTAVRLPRIPPTIALVVLSLIWAALDPVINLRGEAPWDVTPVNAYWQIASGLQSMGLNAGDNIAVACEGMRSSRWARLNRAHIVAEMDAYPASSFWQLSKADQQRVLTAFSSTGAIMAITDQPPPSPGNATGWQEVGTTGYYAYLLPTRPSR